MLEEIDEAGAENLRTIRNLIIDFVEAHEDRKHGGNICELYRVSVIAYFAHSLGMPSTQVDSLSKVIEEYETNYPNYDIYGDNGNGDIGDKPDESVN